MMTFIPRRPIPLIRPPLARPPLARPPLARPPLARQLALLAGGAALLALAGCFGGGVSGGMADGMQLTAEEAAATPPEDGPIKFVWEGADGKRTVLISTTTSTTSSPTETFIARQKIAEHRQQPTHAHRLLPSINPATEGSTPPQSGDQRVIRLVPLDAGLVIRKRAAAAAGDVTTLGVTQEEIDRTRLTP